jgi:hypothetical protein
MRAVLFFHGLVLALLVACTSTDAGGPGTQPAPATAEGDAAAAPSAPSAPSLEDAGATPEAAAAPDCSIEALDPAPNVAVVFLFASPSVPVPTMSGGTLSGTYVIKKARVFLPHTAEGLVDARASSGNVACWAIFSGSRYRLSLDSKLSIATVGGPQDATMSTESQGGFTTNGPALKLDHECDAPMANEAGYAFTDVGSADPVLLIQQSTPYGDVYIELTAEKQ